MKIAIIIIAIVVVVVFLGLLFRITYVMGLQKGFENCYTQIVSGKIKINRNRSKKVHLPGFKSGTPKKRK